MNACGEVDAEQQFPMSWEQLRFARGSDVSLESELHSEAVDVEQVGCTGGIGRFDRSSRFVG